MSQLAYNQAEAAAMLGVSLNTFKAHVRPRIKCCYIGGVRRYSHAELERYLRRVES